MAIIFVTTDMAKWGVGTGILMDPEEIDNNFWEVIERILDLENPGSDGINGIDHFEISGDQFYVHLTDLTVLGPYPFPVFNTAFRGEWLPLTVYAKHDRFIANGSIYEVLLAHTSAATFDAGANNGMGGDYYGLWLELPELQLPPGGGDNFVLAKVSTSDFDIQWVNSAVPPGGDTGDVLRKNTGEDYDHDWIDPIDLPATASAVITVATTLLTLTEAYGNRYLRFTHDDGCLVTVPLHATFPIAIGREFHLRQVGASPIALVEELSSDDDVIINPARIGFDNTTPWQGATLTLKKVAINEWDVIGPAGDAFSDSSA